MYIYRQIYDIDICICIRSDIMISFIYELHSNRSQHNPFDFYTPFNDIFLTYYSTPRPTLFFSFWLTFEYFSSVKIEETRESIKGGSKKSK